MDKLIKSVSEKSWKEFRGESFKHGMRMGEFLEQLLEEHKISEKRKDGWEFILSRKGSLTAKQADEVKRATSAFEKEVEFE